MYVCVCVRASVSVYLAQMLSVNLSVSACMHLCALRTDEGGDLGVDDAAGEEVEVVLHRVDHHCVSCVVAALQRRDRDR